MTFRQLIGGGELEGGIVGVINDVLIPLVGALAFLMFVWGVVNYFFLQGDNAEARAKGQQFMFWGIIGLVVLFALWGFVNLVLSTLGITPSA